MPKAAYPNDAKQQFQYLVDEGERYLARKNGIASTTNRSWRRRAQNWLKENVPNSGLAYDLMVVPHNQIQRALAVLLRARTLVPFLRDESAVSVPKPANVKKVFIVHGREDGLKNEVARMLTGVGLEPVILHEQPNKGRTIIEKFIDHSDVAFAVILLTADDVGGLANTSFSDLRKRARQNVILELGFFLGRLGRQRVAAVYDEAVEMPSDYTGVLYVKHDTGGVWRYMLAKEIRAAGISVDLNKL